MFGRFCLFIRPAFDVSTGALEVSEALKGLGVERLFAPTGELVVLDPGQNPALPPQCVANIYETSHISLDRQGTEAEAAAAVVIDGVGASAFEQPTEPVPVTLDGPFLFFLQEARTASVLFMGHVVDPGKD